MPPGQPVIVGLTLDQLATLWGSLGLTCRAHIAGGPESPAGYNVHCEGRRDIDNADVVAEADLWAPDAIVSWSIGVTSIDDSLDAAAVAAKWLTPFADLTGDGATEWVNGHIGDTACGLGCTRHVAGGDLSYYSGIGAAQKLILLAVSEAS